VSVELAFDWDEANVSHIARHGVDPAEAEQVLGNDPLDLNFESVEGESRWTSVGHSNALRVLLVVWTIRGDRCRAVTARSAGKKVERAYMRQRTI